MADTPDPAPETPDVTTEPVPVPDVPDDAFVTAVATATGKKQRIPREWLEHSKAGVPGYAFELPPSTRTAKKTVKES